jgi:hypothetical protein
VLSLMGGAGAGALGAPAGRCAMVGAGADGRGGAPPTVGAAMLGAGGAEMLGVGGLGATGAPGAAGGASAALRVTRTVSFFSGMLEVCLEAGIDEVARGAGIGEDGRGGGISFSLMGRRFLDCEVGKGNQPAPGLSNFLLAAGRKSGIFPVSGSKSPHSLRVLDPASIGL